MKRVKYETLGDLLEQRKAEQEQPTGQQETIDRAAERVATWPEWKRNAVRYRDDSGQQAGAEIPLEQMSEAEAELAQIKERYATYRAAATAQAKLLTAQIEMLKEQLAAARNKALEEAAKVCYSLGVETASYEGKAEDYRNYTFTELWAHRAYGQFHCAKAVRALQTPSDQGAAKDGK